MATACDDSVTEQSPLDVIRGEIVEVFERILSKVRARRDELLEQVSEMRREFETKNISMTDNLRRLEEIRGSFEKMSVKQNLAMKKQQESLAGIDSEIEKLKIGLSDDSEFKFNCSINQLIEQVKHFGEVIDESSVVAKYRSKLTAVRTIDEANTLTVEDAPRILVFNANTLSHITNLTEDRGVSCIASSKEFVYVGYCGDYMEQFRSSDYSIVKTLYATPSSGIFISSENQVYVLSYSNKTYKFRIYDRALNLKEERDLCYQWPESEPKISVKQTREQFYILFDEQLLVFSKEGKNTHSIFHGKENSMIVKNIGSFCVDEIGNIIVTDSATNSIKFFSPEGDLFHKIGEDTVGSDEVVGATEVVAYNGKVIVLCYMAVEVEEYYDKCIRTY